LHYKIGPKIRALRLNKKLGLLQLGEHTGLSSAMLSKIERGQLFPTLPTLLRIALVFGVGLEHLAEIQVDTLGRCRASHAEERQGREDRR
jgi:transcriptional regulator with XRE-family HTH domain